jgi:A/G-specific adenine glycosylase
MLQQTQVDTVKPYYERFLKRFPDIGTLARARLDTVLKCWEGLGYYGRARHMHAAARLIMKEYHGRFPRNVDTLLSLPGIGRYTAGAIASIAFAQRTPVLDGNVTRVLCRVFRMVDDPRTVGMQQQLWDLGARLLPSRRPGVFNQALMELGALVCKRDNPLCPTCPLCALCQANRYGLQALIPLRRPAKSLPHYTVVVGVIRHQGRILIDRRRLQGLLGGLWEFPGGKRKSGESLKDALLREVREELGIHIAVDRRLVKVRHDYSHFRITLYAFECRYISGTPTPHACAAVKWIKPQHLQRYAFPGANQKIIQALAGPV